MLGQEKEEFNCHNNLMDTRSRKHVFKWWILPQSMNHTSHKIALLEVYELRHLVLSAPPFLLWRTTPTTRHNCPSFFWLWIWNAVWYLNEPIPESWTWEGYKIKAAQCPWREYWSTCFAIPKECIMKHQIHSKYEILVSFPDKAVIHCSVLQALSNDQLTQFQGKRFN